MPSPIAKLSDRALLETAFLAADAAGAALRARFRSRVSIDNKAGPGATRSFDPVTDADRAAEAEITKVVRARHPDHAILGEEYGAVAGTARYRWVIDPIDGTRSFIIGFPTWGTLIGLEEDGVPIVGVMDQPYTGERAWADRSESHLRAVTGEVRRIATRPCAALADALVMATAPDMFREGDEAEVFADIRGQARMTRYGGDCYAYVMLAAGHVDVVIEAGLQPYDVVALIPIIERAGGRVTTWDGKPAVGGGRILATGDPALHDAILTRIAQM